MARMSRLTELARELPGYTAAKKTYQAAMGPILSAAFTFERKRIEAELSQRMDVVLQALQRRQEEMETDLLRLRETVDRLGVEATRAELDDLKRDLKRLADSLTKKG